MINRLIFILLFSLASIAYAQNDDLIFGTLDGISGAAKFAPEAIVMADESGEEHLVVFYVNEAGVQFTVFSQDSHEFLNHTMGPYLLPHRVMTSKAFSPVPVQLNGTYYLFGSDLRTSGACSPEVDCYFALLNHFSGLEDLIHHADPHAIDTRAHFSTSLALDKNAPRFSATTIGPGGIDDSIEITTLPPAQEEFFHHRCKVDLQDERVPFNCSGRNYYMDDYDYDISGPTVMPHVTINGVKNTFLIAPGKQNRLSLHHFYNVAPVGDRPPFGSLDYDYDVTAVELPHRPGAVEANGVLQFYYAAPSSGLVMKTSVASANILTAAQQWETPYAIYENSKTNRAITALIFKNRVYALFVDKDTGTLRYVSDVVVE